MLSSSGCSKIESGISGLSTILDIAVSPGHWLINAGMACIDTVVRKTELCTGWVSWTRRKCVGWVDKTSTECAESVIQTTKTCTDFLPWPLDYLCFAFTFVSALVCVAWYIVTTTACYLWQVITYSACVASFLVAFLVCAPIPIVGMLMTLFGVILGSLAVVPSALVLALGFWIFGCWEWKGRTPPGTALPETPE